MMRIFQTIAVQTTPLPGRTTTRVGRRCWLALAYCGFLPVLLFSLASVRADEPRIQFDGKQIVEVNGLSEAQVASLRTRMAEKDATSPLSVFVVGADGAISKTALAGTTKLEGKTLRFRAHFPFEKGTTYQAALQLASAGSAKKSVTQRFSMTKKTAGATTTVTAVYPTQDVLPENQLKLYLHFSAPMNRGEIYRRVHLLDEKGQAIDLPFLELEQELWDARQERITLLFDPGRIKRGLKPREEVGPVLEEGKRYTFVIDADWSDAEGNPLAEGFRKSFRAGPPDDQIVDTAQWKLSTPEANTRNALTIQFPKAMDHALAERLIWVEGADGKRLEGTTTLTEHEHKWEFRPAANWVPGDHRVAADSTIEDLAGNSIAKPFEIDVLRPVQKKTEVKISRLPFAVR
jgi:hypothetical protein